MSADSIIVGCLFPFTDDRGQLFYRIIDILKQHEECKFVILENVRNLADNKENWQIVCDELKELGFVITEEPIIESPHHFGVPQIRDRVYILGVKKQYIDGRRKMPDGYITRDVLSIDKYHCLPVLTHRSSIVN